jgi:hypothetical protein
VSRLSKFREVHKICSRLLTVLPRYRGLCSTTTSLRLPTPTTSPRQSLLRCSIAAKKRVYQGDEYMARIAAERIVEHLAQARFVVMRKPALGGHSALGRGFEF